MLSEAIHGVPVKLPGAASASSGIESSKQRVGTEVDRLFGESPAGILPLGKLFA